MPFEIAPSPVTRFHTLSNTGTAAMVAGWWTMCAAKTVGFTAGGGVAVSMWADIYELAYRNAIEQTRRFLPGRYVEPSMN